MRPIYLTLLTALAFWILTPCHAQVTEGSDTYLVEVTAMEHAFEAPVEIPSRWSTFRLKNEGAETHFVFLTRLPEGRTFDDYMENVAVHFNQVWHAMRSGELNRAEASEQLAQAIPKWFWSAERMGGRASWQEAT